MAEDNQWQCVVTANVFDKLQLVIDHLIPAIAIGEVVEVAVGLSGFAVAAVVVGGNMKTLLIEVGG